MPQDATPPRTLLKCAKCGSQHDVTGRRAGVRLKCGNCGAILTVPGNGLAGRVIGGYRILKVIGQGGMGAVYLAEQVRLKRKVAFKALKGQRAKAREALAGFHREAISAAQLSHPNIVQVYDISMADGIPFISMEYVDGKTLQDLLTERKKLSPAETVRIATQCLEALGRAHQAGIVHRDIKPGNILLDAEGKVKITDFGLARMLDGGTAAVGEKRYGTVLYISPEQIVSADVDSRADLYSLGATMFEMLLGRPPYRAATARETLRMVAKDPVPDPRRLDQGVPRPLADIVMKMLAKDPEERCQTAEEVLEAFRKAGLGGGSQAGDDASGRFFLGRKASLTALIGLALLGGFTAAYGFGLGPFGGGPNAQADPSDQGEASERAEEERLQEIEGMLSFARQFDEENPRSYTEIVEAYQAVAELGEDTRYGLEAKTRMAAVQKRRREAAAAHFREIRDTAFGLASQLKIGEALELTRRWPSEYDGTGFEARLPGVRERLNKIVEEEIARVVSETRKAVDDEDFAAAREELARLKEIDLDEIKDRIVKLEGEIEARRLEVERRWEREAGPRYRDLLVEVHGLTRQRRFDQARKRLDEAYADKKLASVRPLIRREIENVKTAKAILEHALRALESGQAGGLRIRGILHKFNGIQDGEAVYELYSGGPEHRVPIDDINVREILRLAKVALEPMTPEKHVSLGVFCLYAGFYSEAQEVFEQVLRDGAKAPPYLRQRAETASIAADYDLEN